MRTFLLIGEGEKICLLLIDEALPLVCRRRAYIQWEALGNGSEMMYKQRTYIKGVHGMEEKLLMDMANNSKKKEKVSNDPR